MRLAAESGYLRAQRPPEPPPEPPAEPIIVPPPREPPEPVPVPPGEPPIELPPEPPPEMPPEPPPAAEHGILPAIAVRPSSSVPPICQSGAVLASGEYTADGREERRRH